MKKAFLLGIALLIVCGASAQKYRKKVGKPEYNNSIGISLTHLANAHIHLTYETAVSGRASIGGNVQYKLGGTLFGMELYDEGFEINPMVKYYLSGQANSHGFYAQLELLLGYYHYSSGNIGSVYEYSTYGYGLSPRLGYLFKFPNPHWAVDLSAGWRFWKDVEGVGDPYLESLTGIIASAGSLKLVYRF